MIQQQLKQLLHPWVLIPTVVALVFNAAIWALLFWQLPPTDATLLLHYNVYFGVDLSGAWNQLLWLPGSGLVIIVLNAVIAVSQRQVDRFMVSILSTCSALYQAMLLGALLLIVLLNG